MSKAFETIEDRARENDTLALLASRKGLTFELLERFSPVDAKLYKDGKLLSFAEVKTYKRNFANARDFIMISLKKIAELQKISIESKVPCCVVYKFDDEVRYYFLSEIKDAKVNWDGRKAREGSTYDQELVVQVPKTLFKLI